MQIQDYVTIAAMEAIPHSWPVPEPIKAAFFDIDGTLCHLGNPELLPASVEALEALRARGIRCFVASGRSPANLRGFRTDLFDGMVFFNGQFCVVGETPVHDLHFSRESLDALFALAQTTDRAMTFQGRAQLFSVRRSENFMRVYHAILDDFPLRAPEAIYGQDVYQASIECLPGEEEGLARKLVGCEVVRWCPTFVDIIPAGGGKGRGIRAVLDHLGCSRDGAVAFGDSENDLSMFEACGTCIAVGAATADVKAAATYITDDIDDGGILNACVRLGIA